MVVGAHFLWPPAHVKEKIPYSCNAPSCFQCRCICCKSAWFLVCAACSLEMNGGACISLIWAKPQLNRLAHWVSLWIDIDHFFFLFTVHWVEWANYMFCLAWPECFWRVLESVTIGREPGHVSMPNTWGNTVYLQWLAFGKGWVLLAMVVPISDLKPGKACRWFFSVQPVKHDAVQLPWWYNQINLINFSINIIFRASWSKQFD